DGPGKGLDSKRIGLGEGAEILKSACKNGEDIVFMNYGSVTFLGEKLEGTDVDMRYGCGSGGCDFAIFLYNGKKFSKVSREGMVSELYGASKNRNGRVCPDLVFGPGATHQVMDEDNPPDCSVMKFEAGTY